MLPFNNTQLKVRAFGDISTFYYESVQYKRYIQKVQNKLLRMMTGTKLEDKVNTSILLKQMNMMSVNQINAQIKIQEIWKALNIENYPLKLERQTVNENSIATRACTSGKLVESGRSVIAQKTCVNDAIKLWNNAPLQVTQSLTLSQIKAQSKLYAKTLPL